MGFSKSSSKREVYRETELPEETNKQKISNKQLNIPPKGIRKTRNPPANEGDIRNVGWIPGLGSYPGEGNSNSLQYFCLEKFHEQRSLVGHSPWGHKELDTYTLV